MATFFGIGIKEFKKISEREYIFELDVPAKVIAYIIADMERKSEIIKITKFKEQNLDIQFNLVEQKNGIVYVCIDEQLPKEKKEIVLRSLPQIAKHEAYNIVHWNGIFVIVTDSLIKIIHEEMNQIKDSNILSEVIKRGSIFLS